MFVSVFQLFILLVTNVASSILTNTPENGDYTNVSLQNFIDSKITTDIKFDIPEVSQRYVVKQLNSLQDGKAVGLDGLSPKILRISAAVIAPPLTRILNLSIRTGTFPQVWKVAKVVPLHKNGSPSDLSNY